MHLIGHRKDMILSDREGDHIQGLRQTGRVADTEVREKLTMGKKPRDDSDRLHVLLEKTGRLMEQPLEVPESPHGIRGCRCCISYQSVQIHKIF